MYRINPFIRIYERENVKALFSTLNLKTLYVSQEIYDKMLIEPTNQLLEEKFLVPPDFNALEYFNENTYRQKDNNINIVYFLLTSVCNFKCRYCFVESRIEKHDNAFMSKETAEKGIQLLTRNISNNSDVATIIFYGGEPFLNFDVLKYIVKRTKEFQMNVKFSVVSNGSIMNAEIIDFIKEHNIKISISLDGLESTNDEMRIDYNNKGSFNKIVSSIAALCQNGIQPGVSCTISTHNMNKLDEIIPVLEKYNIKGIGYNLPAENGNIVISETEKQIMVKNLLKVEDIIFEKRIFEDRVINRRLKSFVEKKKWIKDCAGYGHQIAITPTGQVGICHGLWPDEINQKDNIYYDIDVNYTGQVKEHPVWQEWYNRTPFNMPQCWNCEAISLCGGGCAKNAFLRSGSIWDIDTDICILMKETVPWIIWKYFDVRVKPEFNTK
ncbi:MAG: radical SAM protein [Prevotellaceae bacterium]|jgi:uncharacterized protein|nr:radical SAM protein [Prevotellaceae bacterium]